MKRLRAYLLRIAGVVPSKRRERELADELDSHLQMHVDDNIRAGMSPEQARREAILKLGGVEPTKEAWRDRSTVPLVENLLRDIRFATRQLRKNPGFTATAILMLSLGVCASVAMFAFVEAALIRPLPYRNPEQLVGVFESIPLFPRSALSYPDYLDWKKLNTVFRSLDVFQNRGFRLNTPSGVEPARGVRVSAGFFRTLGVAPVLGRDFYEGEDSPAAPRTVMLSYSTWQSRYGAETGVLGKTVTLDGEPSVIVGVLPSRFQFAPVGPAEFWIPIHASGNCDPRRSCHALEGVARLKTGVSLQAALADVTTIARNLEKQYPDSNRDQGAALAPLTAVIVGQIRPTLLMLLSGAALLLLIACVNVMSLVLVRCESRRREMAVRSALGASGARLSCQFLAEGLLLVVVSGALGLAASDWTMRLLTHLIPADRLARMPYLIGLGLNSRVLVFAGAILAFAALLFFATPALYLKVSEMGAGLAEGSRGSAGKTWRRLGWKLVVVELATAVVLLVGAGLLGKSFYRVLHVDLGLQPDHLAILQLAVPQAAYAKNSQLLALGREVVRRVENLPGVTSAGLSNDLPVSGWSNTMWFRILGRPWHGEHIEVPQRDVSARYFRTIEAKLVRGRYFTETEDTSKPSVAIINQSLARKYFPTEDPIGKQISYMSIPPAPIEIVGIVADIKEGQPDTANQPVLYRPFNQDPDSFFSLTVRASQGEESLLPAMAATIHRIDPRIATAGAATMRERIRNAPSTYLHRSSAWLVGGFAVLALLLGVIGLYGVVAYSVSQRTREIGIRVALGAQRGAVYSMILREAGRLAAWGLVLGVVCSLGVATLLRGLLFGVGSWDVPTLAAVTVTLGSASLLASYIPARRAASVNPVETLRVE